MALTRGTASVLTMQKLNMNSVLESTNVDLSACYSAALLFKQAQTSATAHTGTLNVVQVNYVGDGDKGWVTHTKFVGPTGTGNTEATTVATAAGTTSLTYASQTGYGTASTYGSERWRLIEDATMANSEFWYEASVLNATQSSAMDPLANAHAASSTLHNIAASYYIALPSEAMSVRMFIDNTYDPDGSSVAVEATVVKITGL